MSVKKWLLRLAARQLITDKSKPIDVKDLIYVGCDSSGKRYYTWEQLTDIPRNRYLEIERINTYIDNKIGKVSLNTLCHAIEKINHAIIVETNKDKLVTLHAQLSSLVSEIRFRDQYAIPKEVFISLAALICVREDETPSTYSTSIQTEKTTIFEKELNEGNDFFLKTNHFKSLIPSLVMSEEAWSNHLHLLVSQEVAEKQRLTTILSESELQDIKKGKTS